MGCSICKNATEACSRMPVCLFEEPPRSELATLRAEIEQLRRERDAIRNETLEEAAKPELVAVAFHKWHQGAGFYRWFSTQPLWRKELAEDAFRTGYAAAIRNLKEPSDE